MSRAWKLWSVFRGLIGLAIVLCCLRPPSGIVLLGPQQRVESINGKMGIHTRLTDEVEDYDRIISLLPIIIMAEPCQGGLFLPFGSTTRTSCCLHDNPLTTISLF